MFDLFYTKLEQALLPESAGNQEGHIWKYFKEARDYGNWECTLRKGFVNALDNADQIELKKSVFNLGEKYFATRPLTKINTDKAADKIASELIKTFRGPTKTEFKGGLLDEPEIGPLSKRLQEIYLKTVPNLTQKWGKKESKIQPWSWTSKALHFTKPELFPILDSLAYLSWDIAIKRLNLKTKRRWPYENICLLYREIWDGFSPPQKQNIKDKVSALQNNFELPFFSVIDAFDKHFWKAGSEKNRNPNNILFGDRADRFIGDFDVTRVKRD